MGNALCASDDAGLRMALTARREACSALVREHIDWALGMSAIPNHETTLPP
jgi:hypothetical protein